jgi:hypothetical protein
VVCGGTQVLRRQLNRVVAIAFRVNGDLR